MRSIFIIFGIVLFSACTATDQPKVTETIYKVQPGHWTGKSQTQYSAAKSPIEPYVHDWCLTSETVAISATELAEALAGFVADNRGDCKVSDMDDQAYRLQFGLKCTLENVKMAGEGVMTYARDGKTTDMTIEIKSANEQQPVTFSREAHQEWLNGTCPPSVD